MQLEKGSCSYAPKQESLVLEVFNQFELAYY